MMESKTIDDTEMRRLLDDFSAELATTRIDGQSTAYQTPVQSLPQHGVFFRWPEQPVEEWIHPDDLQSAQRLLPGGRIFQLQQCDDAKDHRLGYSVLIYGDIAIRVLPAMWLRVQDTAYKVGDRVEVLSQNGTQQPLIGTLAEIYYNPVSRQIEYTIETRLMILSKKFSSEDFRPCGRLGVPMSVREQKILHQFRH